jgi:hypothetical protein
MNRRRFLRLLGAGAAGLAVAPLLPLVAPERPKLTVNKLPSIRYIQSYDARTDSWVNRMDVLYGFAELRPSLACRVSV